MAVDFKKRLLDATLNDLKEVVKAVMDEKTKAGPVLEPAQEEEQPFKLYTNDSLKELLGVQDKLIKKYRDEGWLGFSKVGDKFWYSQDDVDRFLSVNHFDPFVGFGDD